MKQIPLTYSYGQDPNNLLGYVMPMRRSISKSADTIWKLYVADPTAFSIEPAYIEHKDGTIEIVEFSIVPKQKAPSMALDDLVADLD